MRRKLYLVDGMSHLYRAYYAIQGLTSRTGRPTNAVYGFTNMLRKLISEENPEFLGVAVDLTGPTVRHLKYEGYKANRRPMPDDLRQQVPDVRRVCEVLKVPILSFEGFEADDVIGTLARQAVAEGLDVVIVTIDKDLFQLVDKHISVLDTRTMLRLDPKKVEEKFGVPPAQVAEVLALVGDSSDNIPGAPGIGQKGACKLIREYGGLDPLLHRRDEVKRKTYRESLQQNEEQIRQSLDLVQIHQDLDLELDLERLRLSEPDRPAARELFQELEFVSLIEEFLPSSSEIKTDYRQVRTLEEWCRQMREAALEIVSIAVTADQEQKGIGSLGSSTSAGHACWIDAPLDGEEIVKALDQARKVVVHDLKVLLLNSKPDLALPPGRVEDTMLMAYLIDPNRNDFSLARLALEYLQLKLEEPDQKSLFATHGGERVAESADITLRVYETLEPLVKAKGLAPLLHDIEIPLVQVLADMERIGVRLDSELLTRMSGELQETINGLQTRIHELAGTEFNINSPKQLAEILFEKLQLPVVKRTRKAGHYATGVEVLEKLAEEHEIARLILEFRELSKLKSTYLDALPRLVDEGGRIHTSYNQMVASTGRLSSSNPNLQNIPIKSDVGREIRRAFIPRDGWRILAADYSQIELRVMAHLSRDPVLLDAFGKGEDIHDRTAREVFGPQAVIKPAEFRRQAKVINFGIMYGLSAFGLAQSLKISRKEAQQYIDDYFCRYQGVKEWIDQTLEKVRRDAYVTTMFGRIRPIPEIYSKNWNLRGFAERTAINAPIQGTAADLIKMAMVAIHRRIKEKKLASRLILQVHDELVFEVARGELKEMRKLVRTGMEQVAELCVPLKVDLADGPSWYQAK